MGASGHRVALVTLTVDGADGRFHDPVNRSGKSRPTARDLVHDPRAATIEASVRYVNWAWNRLTANMRYRRTMRPYFRGLELQRSGMAHLHVLVRVRDAADFLALRSELRGPEADRSAGLAVMAGFGKVVDVQLARSGGDVARYVTKTQAAGDAAAYATKGVPGAALPRYTRRTAWAQTWAPGWIKPTPLAGFTWRVARASVETVTAALALSGDFHIVDPDSLRVASAASAAGRGS